MRAKGMRAAAIAGLLFLVLALGCAFGRVLNTNVRSYVSTDTPESGGSQVLFFGTSQGANGINPLYVWEAAGIPSYNFCAPGQYIGTTYYVMEDVLGRQKPEAAVLDIRSVTKPEDFLSISNKLYSLPMIADLSIRFRMYRDVIGEDAAWFFPLFRYHNRWKEITRQDFQELYTVLGCVGEHHVQTDYEELPQVEEQAAEPVGERELRYLEAIAALADREGVELILLDMPCYTDEETEKKTQWVREWAKERGIAVCEANRPGAFEGMGLEPEDFYDGAHLNLWGQQKLSSYLGNWLARTCSLEDQRGTAAGDAWENRARESRLVQNDRLLLLEQEPEAIWQRLEAGDYTVALSLVGDYGGEACEMQELLARHGLSGELFSTGGAFVWKSGEGWVFASAGQPEFLWTAELPFDDLAVRGNSWMDENGVSRAQAELLLERTDRSRVMNGLNLVIYSNTQKKLLRAVGFDAADGWRLTE